MDVLAVGEEMGRDGDGGVLVVVAVLVAVVVVAVAAAAAAGVGEAAAVTAAAVVVVVGVAAVVALADGGRRDCIEASWGGETRGGIVGAGGVVVDGPIFEVGEDSRMRTFVDHGRNRKRRQRSGVVAGQGAWMGACRCGREIGRGGFDGVVADAHTVVVGSLSGRLDVEASIVDCFSSYLTASVVTERPLGFGLFLGAMRLVSRAPGSRCLS